MLISPELADKFIRNYKEILLAVCKLRGLQEDQRIHYTLVSARELVRCDPEAIHEAVSFLEKNGINLDEEIVKAVRNIQISKWFYLRDTTKYSIFIDEKSENAYAVHGLTDPIKEVTSGASTFFEAGLFQLNGKYVCDGLASSLVYFGPGIRSSLNESLKAIKQQKRFHKNAL